ncbi:MAG TPA: proline dehydrogenase family protein [Candidatus Polarisedimenticolaceae bacterium]|nr:proline dehydrogenase family protein [Candidatus Polarisedimenticolaceae bacterium]
MAISGSLAIQLSFTNEMTTRADTTEQAVQTLARSLYRKAAEHKPSIFEARDLLGRMIDWSLEDDSLRTALFRFVDVLPSLQSSAEIGRHLEEYFARVDHALGGLVYVAQALQAGRWVAPVVRRNVVSFARRFIAEEKTDELIPILSGLRAEPAAFTLDVVGEATVSDSEAVAMQKRYLNLLRSLSGAAAAWPPRPQIDESPSGPIPRVNLSVKLSSLCARFDPLDPETQTAVRQRLRSILREAARLDAALTIDMEHYAFKPLTYQIFRALLEEEEFAETPVVGLAVQAYLRDTGSDLADLIGWAKQRGRRIGIRLVKGAYWDSEVAWAQQKNWPVPVFWRRRRPMPIMNGLAACCWKTMRSSMPLSAAITCVVWPTRLSQPIIWACRPRAMKFKCSTAWPNRFAARSSKMARGCVSIFRLASCFRECPI